MGRASLILVLLMSVLFTNIILRMQTNMLKLPEMLTSHQIKRECENISDYSLRYAIDYGADKVNTWKNLGYKVVKVIFDGTEGEQQSVTGDTLTTRTASFPVAIGAIDSLEFRQIDILYHGGHGSVEEIRFQAFSDVHGTLQNKTMDYNAEVAFNFIPVINPNVFYFEMESQLPGNKIMGDSSGNDNHAYDHGHVMTFPSNHGGLGVAHSRYGWYHEDENDAAYVPDDPTIHMTNKFTLVCFAKIDKMLEGQNAALIWLPSPLEFGAIDELENGEEIGPFEGLDPPPAMAIWLGDDGMIHFGVGFYHGGGTNHA